jgi:hypothetical protein
MRAVVVLITLLAFSSWSFAQQQNIAGKWKHASKPAIIQFDMEAGEAFVYQHDQANSAGLNLIKNIVQTKDDKSRWEGEMFDGYQNKYVRVTINAAADKTLAITTANKQVVLKLVR